MKKNVLALLALALVMALLVTGCKKTEEETPDVTDKLQDMLQVSSVVYHKLEGGYNEYLKASRQYGKLVPYIGKRTLMDMGDGVHLEYNWWGFCTTEGLIVTDAVYSDIQWYETEAGEGIYVMERIDEDDPSKHEAWIAADDGAWTVDLGENGYLVDCNNSRIVTSVANPDDPVPYTIYDYYGNLIEAIKPGKNEQIYMSGFSGGYAFLERFVGDNQYGYYINRSGLQMFPHSFSAGQDFIDGKAIVCTTDDLYGILKDNGTWFIEPGYEHIQRYGEYFVMYDGYDCTVIDSDAYEMARMVETANVWLTVGTEVLYSTSDDNTLRYLASGEPVYNSQTGEVLEDYGWSNNTLLSQVDDSEHILYIMNYAGEVQYTVEDYGDMYETDDNYLIVHTHADRDTVKWVDIKTGKVKLTTEDNLMESEQDGWYYRDNGKTNATLHQLSTGKQVKFPADQLMVQKVAGDIYYQIYNETQMILMNEDMDILVKVYNE